MVQNHNSPKRKRRDYLNRQKRFYPDRKAPLSEGGGPKGRGEGWNNAAHRTLSPKTVLL